MSKRHYKAVIDDVVSTNLSMEEQENLIDLFNATMKSIAPTLARRAWFNTSDFATAKHREVEGFELAMARLDVDGQELWQGKFTKAHQCLTILGSLEK